MGITWGRALAAALLLAGAAGDPDELRAQTVSEFRIPGGVQPTRITMGSDGALWFTAQLSNTIGRITTAGSTNLFKLPTCTPGVTDMGRLSTWCSEPRSITPGPDGALWFTEWMGNKIGRVNTDGSFREYPHPTPRAELGGITTGPDGAVWFTEGRLAKIGRITTEGVLTAFELPVDGRRDGSVDLKGPAAITTGSDGALWFTRPNKIGRITTDGKVTEFQIPSANSTPAAITLGPDGALWFTFNVYPREVQQIDLITGRKWWPQGSPPVTDKIGRITPLGAITEFDLGYGLGVQEITTGPDGTLWYAQNYKNKIGRITTDGVVTDSIPTPDSQPMGITTGPDGALWFTEGRTGKIGRIGSSKATVEIYNRAISKCCTDIAVGPDGALWFSEAMELDRGTIILGRKIGRLGAEDVITSFPDNTDLDLPSGITTGPDGAVWFVEQHGDQIGRISAAGQVQRFAIPTADSLPTVIVTGPDGALWFNEKGGNKIGRITTSGDITEYVIPTLRSEPTSIALGRDGALWFTEKSGNKIGRISANGVIREFPIPTANSSPEMITAGPDGALWFTESSGNKIGRITIDGRITEFSVLTSNSGLSSITSGPDGALWFIAKTAAKIGRITVAGRISEYALPLQFLSTGGRPSDHRIRVIDGSIKLGPDGALWFPAPAAQRLGRVVLTLTND